MRQWRLINDAPTTGARNMAIDEAILSAVEAGAAPPTLRVYAWHPPCLSLGRGQRLADADLDRIAARGWEIVRRPTGGRAILHTDELTYSVAIPLHHPIAAGGIVESYRAISRALMRALDELGAQPHAERVEKRGEAGGAVCFETPSHYEITVGGRKLVGSAQLRRKSALLQHGSLPLMGEIARICDALAYPDEAARGAAKDQVRARALTLADALDGRVVAWDEAARALAEAFAATFDLDLLPGELSALERVHVDALAADVYANLTPAPRSAEETR